MEASPPVLLWDRGVLEAECERGAVVKEGVEVYLGRTVFADSGTSTVRVQLSRVEERGKRRVVARVSQEDGSGRSWGERSVSGDESCASLDEQLTLVVALLVDTPNAEAPPVEPASSKPTPPPPAPTNNAPEPSTGIVTAPSLQRPRPAPAHLVALGLSALNVGATSGLGLGGGLLISVKPRGFWGVGIEGAIFRPGRENLESGSLEVASMFAAVSLCPLQSVDDSVWWSACASFGAAHLRVHSRRLLEARTRGQWFALPGLSVRGAYVFSQRWLLGGGVVAAVPLSPDRYVYRDASGQSQLAFQVSSLVLTAQLGVGFVLN